MLTRLLTTKTKLLLVLLVFFFKIEAMDQLGENPFKGIPKELNLEMFFNLICDSETIQEASKKLHTFQRVDQTFYHLINDPQLTQHIVKALHKKLNEPKLFIRYVLHSKEAQRQLIERMKIISQYAFLHHNDLMREGKKTFKKSSSSTTFALQQTCDVLHQKRKKDPGFWQNTQDVTDEYRTITLPDRIRVNVGAYKYKFEGEWVARDLLYLAENISGKLPKDVTEIFKNRELKERLSHEFIREITLFKMISSQIFDDFHDERPYGGTTIIHDQMQARINAIVNE